MGATARRSQRPGKGRLPLVVALGLALIGATECGPAPSAPPAPTPVVGGDVSPPPWQRTEIRADCADYDGLRRPYFGDQHVHTAFSFDAYGRGTRGGPRDAYDFAQGTTINIPDANGGQNRATQIDRPLDWLMVADHAEFMGELRECTTPASGAFDEIACALTRDPFGGSRTLWPLLIADFSAIPPFVQQPLMCDLPGVDCEGSAVSVWQEIQAAAEEAYDRTAVCAFTSFVGYEHTADLASPLIVGLPYTASVHRNLMFRNENVPASAESAVESALLVQDAVVPRGNPEAMIRAIDGRLWDVMDGCNDGGTGCEVLAIPHNSNLSSGLLWTDPLDATVAERRRKNEPVAEIFQQKGGSECRYDRLIGSGVRTADELCSFEQQTGRSTNNRGKEPPADQYPFQRDNVRNALKDGLAFEQSLGVNPFEFGVVGSTDNHNAVVYTAESENWPGMRGASDADPTERIALDAVFERSPGGLAVAWAEESSRDAIFEAFRRREVYGTSGHRPTLRFFAGDLDTDLCQRADLVEAAYRQGVPMGGEIGAVRSDASPRFLVHALKDPGGGELPGTDLQRIQIVKGWVDGAGQTHEQVFEVAGNPDNGATVDSATCDPLGAGFADLCALWEDPQFDAAQNAFYYARALDNPSCRWSTRLCQSLGVNPLSPTCDAEAAAAGAELANCCIQEADEPFYSPVVQERAWSSPIWYKRDGVSDLSAKLVRDATSDQLVLSIGLLAIPPGVDPAADDVRVTIADDDEIFSVTLPGGTLAEVQPGLYRFVDPAGAQFGGLQLVSLTIGAEETRLRMNGVGMDLSRADLSDHFVTVEVAVGSVTRSHSRLWISDGARILEY